MGIQLQADGTNASAAAPYPVNLPADDNLAGFVTVQSESDAGTVTGSRTLRALDSSDDYRVRVGTDTLLFNEWFPGTVLNSSKWLYTAVTQTLTVTNGFANLNAGNNTSTTTSVYLASQATFPVYGTFGLWIEFSALLTAAPQANNVVFIGAGSVPGLQAAIADAIGFRLSSSGNAEFALVGSSAGVDVASVSIPNYTTLAPLGTTHLYSIFLGEERAELWIDDVLVAVLNAPAARGGVLESGCCKFFSLVQNVGAVSTAQQLRLGLVSVTQADEPQTMTTGLRNALAGDMCYQASTGSAVANTVQWANNANPTAAVPTNTTAALGSGLGGQFWETYTLAVTTDGIISSFQVPAAAAGVNAKRLVVTGVRISSVVQTAITGGGLIEQWGIAFGHTSVSLATTEAAAAKAPRRKILGVRATGAAAAALTQFSNIEAQFDNAPIVVNPGEFIQVIKKNIAGTVGTAGVVCHAIDISGFWA